MKTLHKAEIVKSLFSDATAGTAAQRGKLRYKQTNEFLNFFSA